ncbi:MAG TPA: pyridoxamine 5'-phosphate oxidase family protein [Polyangiaceae bacterium]|nr:pyridoxamine 5'-phosphate oxidase family protein [Polyangiaceae bacterium]
MNELARDEVDRFLDEQTVGRIGCHDAGLTYVVPVIYARQADALYVMTTEGQKVHMMRKNPSVCFEVDEYEAATGSWRSVIVQGRYEELDGDGKALALSILAQRFGTRRVPTERPRVPLGPIVAFCVRIQSATGRSVRRDGG